MKEELKNRMIVVMVSCASHRTEWIAEKCAEVAMDFYKKREQALDTSNVEDSPCKHEDWDFINQEIAICHICGEYF